MQTTAVHTSHTAAAIVDAASTLSGLLHLEAF